MTRTRAKMSNPMPAESEPTVRERVKALVHASLLKLKAEFEAKAKKADKDGLQALTGPPGPCTKWTPAQWRKYNSQTSDQRFNESNRLMDLQLDYENAAQEIAHIIFTNSFR